MLPAHRLAAVRTGVAEVFEVRRAEARSLGRTHGETEADRPEANSVPAAFLIPVLRFAGSTSPARPELHLPFGPESGTEVSVTPEIALTYAAAPDLVGDGRSPSMRLDDPAKHLGRIRRQP